MHQFLLCLWTNIKCCGSCMRDAGSCGHCKRSLLMLLRCLCERQSCHFNLWLNGQADCAQLAVRPQHRCKSPHGACPSESPESRIDLGVSSCRHQQTYLAPHSTNSLPWYRVYFRVYYHPQITRARMGKEHRAGAPDLAS